MANYYDKVLEDFNFSRESDEAFDDAFDDAYDEGIFTRKRPDKTGSSIKPSNFGKNIVTPTPQGQGNYATKAELKNSLNSISDQVNDLKKANLSINAAISRLEKTSESVAKGFAKEGKAQEATIANTSMMSVLAALINKPTLDPTQLKIVDEKGDPSNLKIDPTDDAKNKSVQVDLTKTLLFTMMPGIISGGSSKKDNNNMWLPLFMVLLLNNGSNGSGSGSSFGSNSDSTLLIVMALMMMGK
jgi:hypothetical protein